MKDFEYRDSRHDEEDEDDEEDDDEDDVQDNAIGEDIGRAIDHAIDDMKFLFKTSIPSQDVIEEFIGRHRGVVGKSWGHRGSILHEIIDKVAVGKKDASWINPDYISPLVAKLVTEYPDLLKTKKDDRTPLYQALRERVYTHTIIDCILDNGRNDDIQRALELPYYEGAVMKTFLTKAFETLGAPKTPGKAKVLSKLVMKASDRALTMRDSTGKCPIHYAVEYKLCSIARVALIKALLERDSNAVAEIRAKSKTGPLNTFLDCEYKRKDDGMTYSIFTEHKRTKVLYEAEEARKEQELKSQENIERPPTKVPASLPVKAKDSPKQDHREKGSKRSEDREYSGRKPGRDRESRRPPEAETMTENEKRRQQLKEQERRELEARQNGNEEGSQPVLALDPRENGMRDKTAETRETVPSIRTAQLKIAHAPNSPAKRIPTGFNVANTATTDKAKSSRSKELSSDVLRKNSDEICKLIKLHYMRTRGIEEVTRFLYGKNPKGKFRIINDEDFRRQFREGPEDGMQFDKVLIYARFPVVYVNRTGRQAQKRQGRGRHDMEFFAEWLEGKGVERIMTLEVQENDQNPHSDESIQTALRNFTVEHLNWQKADLDPMVICETAAIGKDDESALYQTASKGFQRPRKDLRVLTLKWSGNNAALRAWSEPTGLPQMSELRKVILNIPAIQDAIVWIRLNQNLPENQPSENAGEPDNIQDRTQHRTIDVIENWDDSKFESPAASKSEPGPTGMPDAATEHEWINQMKRFARPMRGLWEETLQGSSADDMRGISNADILTLDSLRKKVVVALIDDGINTLDPAFASQYIGGKTFDYRDDEPIGQHYTSANGHGTDMAKMILKVCPMASIYSIKLRTQYSAKGHLIIDESSVAPAIEAALEKGADIISMSWTIPVPKNGTESRKRIDDVLSRACERDVLMFCSSSDQKDQAEHYPAYYNRDKTFLIGAADDSGTTDRYAGSNNDFVFPGVNVITSNELSMSYSNDPAGSAIQTASGSSIATALASGLAAMVIYCFKTSALAAVKMRIAQGNSGSTASGTELVKPQDVDRILCHDDLRKVFGRIGDMGDGKFIPVWQRFRPATERLTDSRSTYEQKRSETALTRNATSEYPKLKRENYLIIFATNDPPQAAFEMSTTTLTPLIDSQHHHQNLVYPSWQQEDLAEDGWHELNQNRINFQDKIRRNVLLDPVGEFE
ncbi:intracellular serine protease [Fusarium longipes]|uniref:Intracellular serine protease n=1 Tax=Fusarium longipes TaxID=694270 RepID=A0A395SMP6_9HYPO|nr:intracellular serine protease [Fusarium longipes]